jgi:hypothetical protein
VVFISQGFGSSVMRHAAREWRHPVGMEAIPGFWIPAIHAGMTGFALVWEREKLSVAKKALICRV